MNVSLRLALGSGTTECYVIANDRGLEQLIHMTDPDTMVFRWGWGKLLELLRLGICLQLQSPTKRFERSTAAARHYNTQVCSSLYGQKRLDILLVRYIHILVTGQYMLLKSGHTQSIVRAVEPKIERSLKQLLPRSSYAQQISLGR